MADENYCYNCNKNFKEEHKVHLKETHGEDIDRGNYQDMFDRYFSGKKENLT